MGAKNEQGKKHNNKKYHKNWCLVKKQCSMCQAESHGRGMLQKELHEGGFEAAHKPPPSYMSRLPESQLNTEVKDISTWLLSSKFIHINYSEEQCLSNCILQLAIKVSLNAWLFSLK